MRHLNGGTSEERNIYLTGHDWQKINSGHWWAPDTGSATKTTHGWYARASGYEEVVTASRIL